MTEQAFINSSSNARRPRKALLGAGVVGLVIGGALGAATGVLASTTKVTETREYVELSQSLDSLHEEQAQAEDELTAARSELDDARRQHDDLLADLPDREAAVEAKEKELAQREADVAALEKRVRRREKAVGIVERRIAANTVPGEGVYEVGKDLAPGTYRSAGSSDCYYAVLNSPDTNDIATNNITSGPAIVSLSRGRYFYTSGCDEWTLQQ